MIPYLIVQYNLLLISITLKILEFYLLNKEQIDKKFKPQTYMSIITYTIMLFKLKNFILATMTYTLIIITLTFATLEIGELNKYSKILDEIIFKWTEKIN